MVDAHCVANSEFGAATAEHPHLTTTNITVAPWHRSMLRLGKVSDLVHDKESVPGNRATKRDHPLSGSSLFPALPFGRRAGR